MKIIKKSVLMAFLLFLTFGNKSADAQEKALKISYRTKNKQVLIKDGKRIRIKLLTGQKISGRFRIIGKDSLEIRKQRLALSSIEKIKKNPLLVQILTTAGLVYTIAFPATLLIYFSSSGSTAAVITLLGSTAGISLSEPNLLKGHYLSESEIEVISLE